MAKGFRSRPTKVHIERSLGATSANLLQGLNSSWTCFTAARYFRRPNELIDVGRDGRQSMKKHAAEILLVLIVIIWFAAIARYAYVILAH